MMVLMGRGVIPGPPLTGGEEPEEEEPRE